jgi:hypothetical protein
VVEAILAAAALSPAQLREAARRALGQPGGAFDELPVATLARPSPEARAVLARRVLAP